MKRISTSLLTPGMIVAEDIFNYNNQLILNKGTTLTDRHITQLDLYGIISIRIEDSHLPFQSDENTSYATRVKNSEAFKEFKKAYDQKLESLKSQIYKTITEEEPINVQKLLSHSLALLENAHGSVNIFDMLHNMRQYDDSTFAHSMNVSLICNVFAHWLKMSPEDIELVTACGLLHDIGKLVIPQDILQKPAALTPDEYNIIKQHTTEGYKLLRKSNVNEHICNAALMHHEKCNGTGYPFGILGSQIDKYAKIVCIADIYDALTSARVYRGPLCPFIAIEEFEHEGYSKYDPALLIPFLENIVNSYLLNQCLLSNGQKGTIVFINKDTPSRPTIQCEHNYIDLSKNPKLKIECLL